MRKAQFWQYCTVQTAEQCMQQRTVDATNTAVGSKGRAQRAAGAVYSRLCALYDAYCVRRACAHPCARRAPLACLLLPARVQAAPRAPDCARVPARKSAAHRLQTANSKGKGNSAKDVARAPLHPQATAKATAKATAGQDSAAGQCTGRKGQCRRAGHSRGSSQHSAHATASARAWACTLRATSSAGAQAADRPEVVKGVEAFSWREWEDCS